MSREEDVISSFCILENGMLWGVEGRGAEEEEVRKE